MAAIATPNTNLSEPLFHPSLWERFDEWFEAAALVALTGLAVIALSIPVVLVVVSIVNVLSWVIGRIW